MSSANMRSASETFFNPKVGTSARARELAFSIRESMGRSREKVSRVSYRSKRDPPDKRRRILDSSVNCITASI